MIKQRRLCSIPPANRGRGLARISSMRAATRTGMVFVGGPVGTCDQHTQRETESDFAVDIKKPDPAVLQMREAFRGACQRVIEQLEVLLAQAETSEEAVYWARELERMRGYNG